MEYYIDSLVYCNVWRESCGVLEEPVLVADCNKCFYKSNWPVSDTIIW